MQPWRALPSLRAWASSWLLARSQPLAPSSPLPLALLRVAVCLIIVLSPEPDRAQVLADGPPALWLAPPGVRWLVPLFGAAAPYMTIVHRLLTASAVLGLLGLWTRLSLAVLAVTFVLTFGGAQLNGAVVHDMHLLWFVLLLGVTPSAQTFSLDAWAKREPLFGGTHSSAAAVGIRVCRLLLGLVYFFPGLHKLLDGGLDWASAENLQHQLWLKWFQAGGSVPWPRVDHWPGVLHAGGIAVLVFELGFVLGACSPRGWQRALAAGAGLTFHAVTQLFLFIPFPSLWACYVVLLGGPRAPLEVASSMSRGALLEPPTRPPLLPVWPIWLVGVGLVLAVSIQGLRGQTQAWPFACYPTFAARAPETILDLALDVESETGQQRTLRIGPLPPLGGRPPRAWSRVWELSGAYGNAISTARLDAFAAELEQHESDWARHPAVVRFYVEQYATAPETYGQAPLSRRLIPELKR